MGSCRGLWRLAGWFPLCAGVSRWAGATLAWSPTPTLPSTPLPASRNCFLICEMGMMPTPDFRQCES